MAESKCVVSAADFDRLSPWVDGKTYLGQTAPLVRPLRTTYDGPERRAPVHDRRWLSVGGRRFGDKKS